MKFAGPLKSMLFAIGLTDEEIEGSRKESPHPLLCGKTARLAMQTLGTEWGRDMIGPDFWVNVWTETAREELHQGGRVVVDDCRFENEAGTVRRLGGTIIRLTGRGGIASGHQSEFMDWAADHEAINDNSISALFQQLDTIAA